MTQQEIITNIKRDLSSFNGKLVSNARDLFTALADKYGCKILNTHGQPFNGSTYEIYRDVTIDNRKLKEVIGHFRNIIAIYGNEHTLQLFNNNVEGGTNLNGNANYILSVNALKR